MALDEAGVQLIAQGVAAYVSDMNKADQSTTGFYKTLGSSDKSASAFQEVMTGALRHVGAALVEFAAQGVKAIICASFMMRRGPFSSFAIRSS